MKVFGVGLSRTGTSSLHVALERLGYRARHFPSLSSFPRLHIRRGELARYDAFTDLPVACFYRELDRRFPGSKFVLTTRDEEAWLRSCERYPRFAPGFEPRRTILALRKRFYGTASFDRERFRSVYRAHDADVRGWFADRPDDLLELDVTAGEGFERLCPFLGRPVPAADFPHENAGSALSSS